MSQVITRETTGWGK